MASCMAQDGMDWHKMAQRRVIDSHNFAKLNQSLAMFKFDNMKIASITSQLKWKAAVLLVLFSIVNNGCLNKEPVQQEGIIGERIKLKNNREYVDYLLAEIDKCKAAGTVFNITDKDGNVKSNPDREWLENVYIGNMETGVTERTGPHEPPPPPGECTETVWATITVTGTSGYAGGILTVYKSSTGTLRGPGFLFLTNTYATPAGSTNMSDKKISYTCDGWCNDYFLTLDGLPAPNSIVITIFHQNYLGEICVTPVTVPNANVGFNSWLIRSLCFCGWG